MGGRECFSQSLLNKQNQFVFLCVSVPQVGTTDVKGKWRRNSDSTLKDGGTQENLFCFLY